MSTRNREKKNKEGKYQMYIRVGYTTNLYENLSLTVVDVDVGD